MSYTYIRRPDTTLFLQSDHLDKILGSSNGILEQAIRTAEEEVWAYLGTCYDLQDEYFAPLSDWSGSTTYLIGDAVWFDDGTNEQVYTCTAETLGDDPTEAAFWEKADPRSPLLIALIVDITLYHLHSRVSPRQIPELRLMRYEAAMDKLKKACNTALPFPRKTEDDYFTPRLSGSAKKDWYL